MHSRLLCTMHIRGGPHAAPTQSQCKQLAPHMQAHAGGIRSASTATPAEGRCYSAGSPGADNTDAATRCERSTCTVWPNMSRTMVEVVAAKRGGAAPWGTRMRWGSCTSGSVSAAGPSCARCRDANTSPSTCSPGMLSSCAAANAPMTDKCLERRCQTSIDRSCAAVSDACG